MNAYRTTRSIALTFTLVALQAATAAAQYASPAGGPAAMPGGGPMPASHGIPMGGGGPMFADPAVAYGYGDACDAYGNPLGGNGGYGVGAGWDQCGPHYFDLSADFMYWRRDRAAEPSLPFASLGVGGPIVLGTDNLDMDSEPGFRLTGRLDLGPLTFVEGAYFGTFFYEESAQATGAANLFSVFSNFGLGTNFLETDGADSQSLNLESELHSSEINWRRYWIGGHPAVTGTWLMGARWVRLTEDFAYQTRVSVPAPAFMDYFVSTENDLVGFQTGGDLAVCIRQGLRFVTTGKAGIYNNRVKQDTRINATTLAPGFAEAAADNSVAFVGEGGISIVADLLPSFSFRLGYEALFMNSLALGANNFNAVAPFGAAVGRVPFVEDDGKALYHGYYAGVEYVR